MTKTPEQIELEKLQSRLTKRFHKACADYGLITDGDHILIGLSGGKDSLALVEFLGCRAQIYVPRFRVTALHVRVKERAYISDLSYLQRFCDEARVPLIIRDTEIHENAVSNSDSALTSNSDSALTSNSDSGLTSNSDSGLTSNSDSGLSAKRSNNPCFLCAWYRRKELFNVAQELGCNKIAFGHHKDDIVETLLMNQIFQGTFATMPPLLQMEKMPLQIIRPLALIEECDLVRYAALRGYEKQKQLCPFEHVSSRAKVKDLLAQIKALNPEAMDSMYNAMTNIKPAYLPHINSQLSTIN